MEIGPVPAGEMAFVESIFVLDTQPRSLGEEHSIVFFSTQDELAYRPPEALVDDRSGLLCLPDNFAGESSEHEQGTVRLSRLASPRRWGGLDPVAYQQAKAVALAEQQDSLCHWLPGVRPHVTMTDFFTPRTVERFTGHRNGAIYGSPVKIPSGSLPAKGLFLCGTDQGLHGIVGAMISGATMANMHVLRAGI